MLDNFQNLFQWNALLYAFLVSLMGFIIFVSHSFSLNPYLRTNGTNVFHSCVSETSICSEITCYMCFSALLCVSECLFMVLESSKCQFVFQSGETSFQTATALNPESLRWPCYSESHEK